MYIIPDVGHLLPLEAPTEVASHLLKFTAAIEGGTAVYHSPVETIAAFDDAFNAGRVDDLLALFSNRATMKMTDGVVIESDPEKLRDTFLSLTSSQPVIRNHIRSILSAGEIALLIIDWTLTITTKDRTLHEESGTATQVLLRSVDGGWRLLISNPSGT